jgi:transcription-repair coupling factor (superfamily II helicase)
LCQINNLIIISQALYVSDGFFSKQSSICKIKEKETKTGLKLLLTFDNVKSTRRALMKRNLGDNEA